MNSGFLISKRKTYELLALLVFNIITYLLWNSFKFNTLFSFGFIWNWVASQEKDIMISNPRRYRFSTLKFVFGFQNLVLKYTEKFPFILKFIVKILPAGLFWLFIIFLNDSEMPWWSVFLGSLCAELMQFDSLFKKEKLDQTS